MSLSFRAERRLSEIREPKVPPPGREGCPLPLSPPQARGETRERVEPTAARAPCGWTRSEGLILQSQDPGGPPVLKQTLSGGGRVPPGWGDRRQQGLSSCSAVSVFCVLDVRLDHAPCLFPFVSWETVRVPS